MQAKFWYCLTFVQHARFLERNQNRVFSSDLFVQLSVFVKFIGFPKTEYLDITAVCHETPWIKKYLGNKLANCCFQTWTKYFICQIKQVKRLFAFCSASKHVISYPEHKLKDLKVTKWRMKVEGWRMKGVLRTNGRLWL